MAELGSPGGTNFLMYRCTRREDNHGGSGGTQDTEVLTR